MTKSSPHPSECQTLFIPPCDNSREDVWSLSCEWNSEPLKKVVYLKPWGSGEAEVRSKPKALGQGAMEFPDLL